MPSGAIFIYGCGQSPSNKAAHRKRLTMPPNDHGDGTRGELLGPYALWCAGQAPSIVSRLRYIDLRRKGLIFRCARDDLNGLKTGRQTRSLRAAPVS